MRHCTTECLSSNLLYIRLLSFICESVHRVFEKGYIVGRCCKIGSLIGVHEGRFNTRRLPVDEAHDSGRLGLRDKDIALVKVCMKQSRTAYALHERTSDQLRDDNFTVFHESKMIIDQAALW
jgi:hypothetical protein